MRNWQTKQNKGGLPDTINSERQGAGEFNAMTVELENGVSKTGQTLAGPDGTTPTAPDDQLSKAMFINGCSAATMQDGGSANTYQLTPVTGSGGLTVPDDYDHFNGGVVMFIPSNTNTGASTLNIGQTAGTLLGSKKLLTIGGLDLGAGDMDTAKYQLVKYDPAADSGTGAFIWIGTLTSGTIASITRGQIDGYICANDAGDTANDISIGTGSCVDSANTENITLSSSLVKRMDAIFAAGSGNGGFYTAAAKAIDTWYHVFAIKKDSDGTVDVYGDISITAANIPLGYTKYRRIMSFLTDGSGNINQFKQLGDYFRWLTPVQDWSVTGSGTSEATVAIRTPLGVECRALFNYSVNGSTAVIDFHHPDVTDTAPVLEAVPFPHYLIAGENSADHWVETNTSSQIQYRSSINTNIEFATIGYIDNRGKDL